MLFFAINAVRNAPRAKTTTPTTIFTIYPEVAEGDMINGRMFCLAMSIAEKRTKPEITVYVILDCLLRAYSRAFIIANTKRTPKIPNGRSERISSFFIHSRMSS